MDLRTRIIITSDDQSRPGFNSAREGLANLERQITQARNALLGLFGVSVGSGLVKSLIETADQYKSIASSIKQAAGENANYEAVQRRVLGIANDSNTALSDTARLYARSSEALKNTGVNQETVLKFTDAVSLSFKANSSSAAEVSSTVTQLTQSIATNAVQWADFGQLADTNLRLVNIAAKNLGYDGIGELKEAISSGKVANVELVDAIVAGFDEIQRAADTAAPTVSGAIQRMSNNFIVYVGAVDQAHGSTASLVSILNFLADHIRTLGALAISLAKYLALIYAAKAVSGVKAYVAAQYQAVLASRAASEAAAHESIVQLEALRVAHATALVRKNAALAILEEARLQRALATTEAERAAAQQALNRAVANASRHTQAASAAWLNYRNATAASEAATTRFTLAVQRLNLALTRMPGLLLKAFTGWILIDLLRETSDEFNRWYTVLEGIIMKGITILTHFFSAAFLDGKTGNLKQKLDEVENHYAEKFAAIGRHQGEAAAAAEAAAEKERQAREKVQASLKAKLDLTEDVYARETAALEQSLVQKQALIDASEQSQAEKDQAKFQLELAADQARVALAAAGANARLQLIADAYNREIEANRSKGKTDVQLDIQYAGARKEVLGQLESAYRESIDHLIEMEAEHRDKALGYGVEIANAEERRAQHLFELEQIGLSNKEALEAQKNMLASEMVKVRELIGQGEFEKAKELSEKTEELAFKIARAEKESYTQGKSLRFDANQAQATYNATVDNTKKALEGLKGQEEGRAKEAKRLAEEQSSALNDVQIKINNINTTIGNLSGLKIQTDTSEIDAALAKINSIPTEKTVVIRTVNEGEAAQTANRYGGLIPAFADGGFAPKSGKLPGFGGGDKIRALLEAGEFIVRKEAVQKLGVPVLDAINQGQLPILRASGGPVGFNLQTEIFKRQLEEKKNKIKAMLEPSYVFYVLSNSGGKHSASTAFSRIEPNLREIHATSKMMRDVKQILEGQLAQYATGWKDTIFGKTKFDRYRQQYIGADILRERLFSDLSGSSAANSASSNPGGLSARMRVPMPSLSIPMPQLPKLSIPAPSFPSFNGPSASAPVGTGSETVTLRFVAPGGSSVAGQFGKNDAETMLRILKEAGAVTQ